MVHILRGLIALGMSSMLVSSQMDTVFQWRYIDYTWPSDDAKREAILSGAYNYTQVVPMDIDVSQDGRIFFSSVNYPGNPARLGTVSTRVEYSGPLIKPYPSWEWTDRSNCDSIIETWKMKIDECNRLWVIDTGRDDKMNKICPAKLLAFDLATDTLVTKVIVPDNIAANSQTKKTLMTTLRVETSGSECESTTVSLLVLWVTQICLDNHQVIGVLSTCAGFVAQDRKRLRFAVGMKVIPKPVVPEEELWVMTNRFTEFLQNRLDYNEYNIFVLRARVKQLISGTKCELPQEVAQKLSNIRETYGSPFPKY
ncbi:hypothetical protein QAD02_022835 [Eretmocerus hayati]|uniref:Uncharacterized protein n=1 Tax=Eretmocerus hayati TaxID=131215 RepID=A0ACC2PW93_9HYME|nr:hypothetical protein QAD02_022835 [Eretmocerus hayati]